MDTPLMKTFWVYNHVYNFQRLNLNPRLELNVDYKNWSTLATYTGYDFAATTFIRTTLIKLLLAERAYASRTRSFGEVARYVRA